MADEQAEEIRSDRGGEPGCEPDGPLGVWFAFFNEVGILHQLSRTLFEARLPDGVTLPHFSVLNHLIRVRDGQTPRALAEAFQVPKTSMTHTLAGLEARGLIAMRANPEDGRSKQVWLTEEGRRFRNEAIRLLSDDVAAIASAIDTERIAAALPLLAEVRRYLDENR
ncbi:MAG: MarR family transcriptional regulator [Alphaproteobacteria bacterium]|nr:MarR family transcriptional regulator [Alphaproteobacteria bacterium]